MAGKCCVSPCMWKYEATILTPTSAIEHVTLLCSQAAWQSIENSNRKGNMDSWRVCNLIHRTNAHNYVNICKWHGWCHSSSFHKCQTFGKLRQRQFLTTNGLFWLRKSGGMWRHRPWTRGFLNIPRYKVKICQNMTTIINDNLCHSNLWSSSFFLKIIFFVTAILS